jgi:hypothetical protein
VETIYWGDIFFGAFAGTGLMFVLFMICVGYYEAFRLARRGDWSGIWFAALLTAGGLLGIASVLR